VSDFGNKIKELREKQGMTQSELAKRLNISDKTISSWENGTRLPRMGLVESISKILNVSKSDLFDNKKSPSLTEQAMQKFNNLSPEEQKQAIDYLDYLISKDQENK
jgi:transcriptional regulator with XRE-family HTH domain